MYLELMCFNFSSSNIFTNTCWPRKFPLNNLPNCDNPMKLLWLKLFVHSCKFWDERTRFVGSIFCKRCIKWIRGTTFISWEFLFFESTFRNFFLTLSWEIFYIFWLNHWKYFRFFDSILTAFYLFCYTFYVIYLFYHLVQSIE